MKHLLNKEFISIDLETLSTHQNASIVSIGAVKFTINEGLKEEFTINITPKSSVDFGLHLEKSTIEFWMKQPKEISDKWKENPVSLPDALIAFNVWLGDCEKSLLLANGSVFDFGILRSSYEVTKIKRPWPYWAEIDLRTISILLDVKLSKGNYHTSLGDAKNQAQQFINLFKE